MKSVPSRTTRALLVLFLCSSQLWNLALLFTGTLLHHSTSWTFFLVLSLLRARLGLSSVRYGPGKNVQGPTPSAKLLVNYSYSGEGRDTGIKWAVTGKPTMLKWRVLNPRSHKGGWPYLHSADYKAKQKYMNMRKRVEGDVTGMEKK